MFEGPHRKDITRGRRQSDRFAGPVTRQNPVDAISLLRPFFIPPINVDVPCLPSVAIFHGRSDGDRRAVG